MAIACQAALRLRLAPAAAAAAAARRGKAVALLLCRAATATARSTEDPGSAFYFERLRDEPPLFPELFQPGRQAVLLAFDPDLGGAVAALSWHNPPAAAAAIGTAVVGEADVHAGASGGAAVLHADGQSGSSSQAATARQQQQHQLQQLDVPGEVAAASAPLPLVLDSLRIELFDMPTEVWKYGTRDKRQPQAAGLIAILQRYVPAGLGSAVDSTAAVPVSSSTASRGGGARKKAAGSSSGGSGARKRRRKGGKEEEAAMAAEAAEAAAADTIQASADGLRGAGAMQQQEQQGAVPMQEQQLEPPVVCAVVEHSSPQFASGKFAWYGFGFFVGMLTGLLAAGGIQYQRAPATTWKAAMGLRRQSKEVSIAMACHLMPAAADLLKRKKDHGRAEALLIAAWGLGVRMRPVGGAAAAADVETEEEEDEEAVVAAAESSEEAELEEA